MEAASRAEQGQRAVHVREEPAQIHLVDDDEWVRTAVGRLLRSRGFHVTLHGNAESFLDAYDPDSAGCIVLDVAMPGLDGPGLQQRLVDQGDAMPIVYLTGSGDVPLCAAAMRNGAVDFLTKPVDEEELVRAVTMALEHDAVRRLARTHTVKTEARLGSLTPREREVLEHVMNGRLNKQIASDIGTAEKTVKVHRARAMEKMRVRSVAELVRMVERAHPGLGWLD
ncbi:response regulator transcription factor [Ramlibacter ginsenosidimutans]|uniref:Response regulator transcription factor n=1 Tax=Ramlibacter ginsenosidimutans TaxID=502333 RepID=A0A934WQ23_9BURK|nr:response regulator [Ramlibacter ginsenosidimutans]MBK6009306.1 response regulator transcription factor [Ramlibacter ginsenosidimutans]